MNTLQNKMQNLVIALLTYGEEYIQYANNHSITYVINDNKYIIKYIYSDIQFPVEETKLKYLDYSITTINIPYEVCKKPVLNFTVRIASFEYNVVFEDRVEMAKLVDKMEQQIRNFNHKLIDTAIDTLTPNNNPMCTIDINGLINDAENNHF